MSFLRSLFTKFKSQLQCMPRRQSVVSFSLMWGSSGSNIEPSELVNESEFMAFRSENNRAMDLRMRIGSVCSDIKSTADKLGSAFRLISDSSQPTPGDLEKFKVLIDILRERYYNLGILIHESPDDYYRYHNEWSSVTQTVVSLLAFIHWIETDNLLLYSEAKETLWSKFSKLDLYDEDRLLAKSMEFKLDFEDYLHGLCIMSNDLPRYVSNQVSASNLDCPYKAVALLNTMEHVFSTLSLPNDHLRQQFDRIRNEI